MGTTREGYIAFGDGGFGKTNKGQSQFAFATGLTDRCRVPSDTFVSALLAETVYPAVDEKLASTGIQIHPTHEILISSCTARGGLSGHGLSKPDARSEGVE